MIYIFLILLLYLLFQVIRKVITKILRQRQCLDDASIHAFYKGQIHRDGEEYGIIIGHLGSCSKCQDRLTNFNAKDYIEDHLVD